MNLDWYYTFLVLSKHLNYHRASEELFLTEPTLHQQIKKLEKHLQVNLFETVGRNLTLTPTGREFIPIVKKIIATYEDGIKKIQLKNKKLETHKHRSFTLHSYLSITEISSRIFWRTTICRYFNYSFTKWYCSRNWK